MPPSPFGKPDPALDLVDFFPLVIARPVGLRLALEKRHALMEAWAAFCEPSAGRMVLPLARPKRR